MFWFVESACHGLRPTATATTPPSWHLDVRDLEASAEGRM